MKSLFLDTAASYIVISLFEDLNKIDEYIDENSKNLSKDFLPLVDNLLKKNNLKIQDINKIFVVVGPGSFTGIRVGVTAAKIIGYCLNTPVIPISELECMATTNTEYTYNVPVIDARRGYVYTGIYDSNLNEILEDTRISIEALKQKLDSKNYVLIGNIDESIKPDYDITKIIKKHYNDKAVDAHLLNPNYLKLTEAEENLLNDSKNW